MIGKHSARKIQNFKAKCKLFTENLAFSLKK